MTFLDGKVEDFSEFKQPPVEGIDSKAEFKRKAKALAEENSLKEERLKQALEELAALRAADRLTGSTAAASAPPSSEVLQQVSQTSAQVVNQLRFTEDNTRKWLIDRDLRMAGWDDRSGEATRCVGK